MKTAISIPDELFEQAEKLAAERCLSRSALYAVALKALVDRAQEDRDTTAIDAAIAKEPPPKADRTFLRAARRQLERDGGKW